MKFFNNKSKIKNQIMLKNQTLLQKSLQKIVFSCLIIIAFSSNFNLFSQTNSAPNDENYTDDGVLQYRIQYNFAERVIFVYKMTYSTEIVRTFSDSTTQNFKRDMDVYLSYWRPSGLVEGFAEIRTGLDSILYNFTDGKQNVKWFSNGNDDLPSIPDFDVVFPIMGRSYTTTISPYFDVAKIEGKILQEGRESIENMPDTTLKKIWKKAVADENLNFYSDMNKNVLQNGRFAIDSTWKMRFTMPIEGIRYTCDTAKVQFYLYDSKNFHVKAEMPYMYANVEDSASVIGLNRDILPVDSTSFATGFWDISVSPRGMLNSAEGEFTTKTKSKYRQMEFTDEIKTKIKYEFVDSYRWVD
jgi:hypothetical protein